MAKKKAKRTKWQRPPPTCKALLLCDLAIVEAVTSKTSIIGTFETFHVKDVPTRLPQFYMFLQLIEGVGRYDIVVEIHDLKENQVIARAPAIGVAWPQKLYKMNIVIPVPRVPVQHAGAYDFVVFVNGEAIERQKFEVRVLTGEADDAENNAE